MPTIHAIRRTIQPCYFAQHEMSEEKVIGIVAFLQSGGTIPPVVVVDYDGDYMPLDGHHRMEASKRLGLAVDAWVIDGEEFEALDCEARVEGMRAEELILCGGIGVYEVAK